MTTSEGDAVRFDRRSKDSTEAKWPSRMETLEEIMDWNPMRTGKAETISPKVMKRIWKTGSE